MSHFAYGALLLQLGLLVGMKVLARRYALRHLGSAGIPTLLAVRDPHHDRTCTLVGVVAVALAVMGAVLMFVP